MRYDIRLKLQQHYPAASDHVRNLVRLLPGDGMHQRIQRRRLEISPAPDERRDWLDFFGNAATYVAWHRPVREVVYELHVEAERLSSREMDISPSLHRLASELSGSGLHPASPLHFHKPSDRIPADTAIAAFAQSAAQQAPSARLAVEALGTALHRALTFDPRATDVTTPPAEAFAARRGVCQDFAQIMIGGLRAVGIPAGYVSGFIRTTPPPGKARLQGVDAMHAWVRAWCGAAQGWQEFDPTNACWAREDYIAVAQGRDYGDAAPVRGAIRTSGSQTTGHSVDMVAL